jgi:hypothetical protein
MSLVRWPSTVCATASADVDAPQSVVYGVLADVRGWPEVFPAINGVTVLLETPARVEVSVDHREGVVPNVLSLSPPDTALLQERKRHHDATFVNEFTALPDGRTRYRVLGQITLRGWRRTLVPVLGWYVRRQMLLLTVEPVRAAAESARGGAGKPR